MTAAPLRTRILLPTYDELENLEPMVRRLRAAAPQASILVLDDDSPDGTGEVADRLAAQDDKVAVLHRTRDRGYGPALREGFARTIADGFDVALTMDVDFSHSPEDVPRLLAAVEAGADVAIGSRYVAGGATPDWSLGRRLLSRGGNFYARTMLGAPLRDMTAGFKAYRTTVLEALDAPHRRTRGYSFQVELAYYAFRLGFRIVEIPIEFRDRRVGQSKMSGSIFLEAVFKVPRLRGQFAKFRQTAAEGT